MSFWQSKNGKEIDGSAKNTFEGGFSLIPDGTTAPAIITKFELSEFGNDKFYKITWRIIGGDFVNRQVWQKIYAFSNDDEKHARALNMMKRIFLLSNFKLDHDMAPTTEDLYPLLNKQMGIKIKEWHVEGKEGNRVSEVHALDNDFAIATGKSLSIVVNNNSENQYIPTNNNYDINMDIPF